MSTNLVTDTRNSVWIYDFPIWTVSGPTNGLRMCQKFLRLQLFGAALVAKHQRTVIALRLVTNPRIEPHLYLTSTIMGMVLAQSIQLAR